MLPEPRRLLQECAAAMRRGQDFPAIWSQILKGHPLVLGVPVQAIQGDRPTLEMPLITGQRLVFDSVRKEFTLG